MRSVNVSDTHNNEEQLHDTEKNTINCIRKDTSGDTKGVDFFSDTKSHIFSDTKVAKSHYDARTIMLALSNEISTYV